MDCQSEKITFDKAKHAYYVQEERVISITQLMPATPGLQFCANLEELAQAGENNHAAVESMMRTGEDYGDPYLVGIKNYLHKMRHIFGEFVAVEQPLFSRRLQFCGTPDLIFTKANIELKRTFGNKKIHALQLAGQNILTEENGLNVENKNHFVIVGDDSGLCKGINVFDRNARPIFIALIKRFQHQDDIGLCKEIDKALKAYLNSL
jgi:hypothetical protein